MPEQRLLKRKAIAFAVILLGLGLTHCGSNKSTFDPSAAVTPNFSSLSKAIFSPGCVSCHGTAGGYTFDSYAGVKAAVSPGNPGGSRLYAVLSGGQMPPGGPQPGSAQLQAISQWITNGANND